LQLDAKELSQRKALVSQSLNTSQLINHIRSHKLALSSNPYQTETSVADSKLSLTAKLNKSASLIRVPARHER